MALRLKKFQVKCGDFEAVTYFYSLFCVCLRPFTVKAPSVLNSWNSWSRSMMLCWRRFFSLPNPFIATLEWSTKPFYLATLSCPHTRTRQSHDLANVRLAFKSFGLNSPLSGIALAPRYIVSRSTSGTRHSREGSQSNYERLK